MTDGARTRDLRSHKWVVRPSGTVKGELWCVHEGSEETGLQYGLQYDLGGPRGDAPSASRRRCRDRAALATERPRIKLPAVGAW
jgi:hypothetical protein